MRSVIVLAMHGALPNDFPRGELQEFIRFHARISRGTGTAGATAERRYRELEVKVRNWPRTEKNDPYFAGSQEMAVELRRLSGRRVILGFNEFCAPDLDEALDQAAGAGAEKVVVVTPMLTRGGEHSEKDIPAAIERARKRHPKILFAFAWPFRPCRVAEFLISHLSDLL
jgi:sirohydrochlorin cobaltochelatase